MDERTAGIRQCVVRTFGRVRARLDNELTHDAYPSTSLRGQTLPAAPPQPGGVEEGRGQAGEEGQVGLRERGEEDGERKGQKQRGMPGGGGGVGTASSTLPCGKEDEEEKFDDDAGGGGDEDENGGTADSEPRP